MNIFVRDVVDAAKTDIRSGPGLQTGAVLLLELVLCVSNYESKWNFLTCPFKRVTFSIQAFSMMSSTPGYCPMLPILTPWVLLHHRFCTKIFVVLGLGEKQSSPISMRVLVTLRPSTFNESKPSVFLGKACARAVRQQFAIYQERHSQMR
jgi:hypothetical protein